MRADHRKSARMIRQLEDVPLAAQYEQGAGEDLPTAELFSEQTFLVTVLQLRGIPVQ